MTSTTDVYRLADVRKVWSGPNKESFELRVNTLTIPRGQKIAALGISGCGKSTLLALLSLAVAPDQANDFSFFDGITRSDVQRLWQQNDQTTLGHLRCRTIGYVPQAGGLVPFLSVRENIELPQRILGKPASGRAADLADRVGVAAHLGKRPGQLSIGERQRVAIARALVNEPSVIIADEPTSAVDPPTADLLTEMLNTMVQELNVAIVIASHDWNRMERFADSVLTFDSSRSGSSITSEVDIQA